MLSQLTVATSTFKDPETEFSGSWEESTTKKRSKTVNKCKYDSYHLLSIIDVNYVLYCVLCNRIFSYSIMMPVKL